MTLAFVAFGLVLMVVVGGAMIMGFLQMRQNHELKIRELELREQEIELRLLEAKAKLALPEFVDAEDPEAVAAYKRARREIEQQ